MPEKSINALFRSSQWPIHRVIHQRVLLRTTSARKVAPNVGCEARTSRMPLAARRGILPPLAGDGAGPQARDARGRLGLGRARPLAESGGGDGGALAAGTYYHQITVRWSHTVPSSLFVSGAGR